MTKTVMSDEHYIYSDNVLLNFKEVVKSGKTNKKTGRFVKEFEKKISTKLELPYALATCSGTTAIQIALEALDVRCGDEVILPAYTFIAVAQAVLSVGGKPIFIDIDDTYNLCPDSLKKNINSKTKAIIAVHMFGNCCNLSEIVKASNGIPIIEDCSQAFGAKFMSKSVGTIGSVSCLSFNKNKVIPTGEGGMVLTSDQKLYRKMKLKQNLGIDKSSGVLQIIESGSKYPLTEMQAVLGLDALNHFDKINTKRELVWKTLRKELSKYPDFFTLPKILNDSIPSYYRLVFEVNGNYADLRDEIIVDLNEQGYPLRSFYPRVLYTYQVFSASSSNYFQDYSEAECVNALQFCKRQLGMECSPYIDVNDIPNFIELLVERMNKLNEN